MPSLFPATSECASILNTACRILETTGIEIQSAAMETQLLSHGLYKNSRGRLCVPSDITRDFFKKVTPHPPTAQPPFTAFAEIVEGRFLDPFDDEYKPWTRERLLYCVKLAEQLPAIDGITMLGCPIEGLNRREQMLEERLFCWNYGAAPGGSIWGVEYCEPLYRLYRAYAELQKTDITQLFHATVFLISPLCFGREEAEQFLWFYERGIRLNLGVMSSIGGSAPLNPAGAMALHLAEALFIGLVNSFFFGTAHVTLAGNLGTMDMKTGTFKFGRPESVFFSNAVTALARQLGTDLYLHTGLTDAVSPSPQAAFEKAVSCLYAAAAGYPANFAAGLIATDEVFSPLQLVLDGEMKRYLQHIHRPVSWAPDACLADLEQALKCGSFLATEQTARDCRRHSWIPQIFPAESFKMQPRSDTANARALLRELDGRPDPRPRLTAAEEKLLRRAAGL